MGKLLVVLKREYLERVRSKWFLVGTLLGPIFFAAITVLPIVISAKTKQSSEVANIAILDATGSGVGDRVAVALHQRFPNAAAPDVRRIAAASLPREEDRALLDVQNKVVRGYLVLDSGTVAGRSARYAGRNGGALGDIELLRSVLREQVLAQRLAGEGIDAARVAAITGVHLELDAEKIGDHGRERGSGLSAVIFGYLVAFLLYMMIMLYGQMVLRGVLEEKTTRVSEMVVSSVSTDTLLAGKVLGIGLVALTQVFAWIGLSVAIGLYVLPLVLGAFAPGAAAPAAAAGGPPSMNATMAALPSLSLGTGLALLAFFVLGFLFYASLFAAAGAMVSSQEDAQQASMPVIVLLISTVIFMTPIATNPGTGLARVLSLIPFSAPILMPLRMILVPVPWYEVLGSIAGVAVACLVAIWISARIYRVGLLMYGKRPSLTELAHWVRYAG
jgi:ABC-2 type transport system permease protein